MEQIPLLSSNPSLINSKFKRDILLLDLIDSHSTLTDFGRQVIAMDEQFQLKVLKEKALTLPKIKSIKDLINNNTKTTAKDLISQLPIDFFDAEKESSKIIYASKAMTWTK